MASAVEVAYEPVRTAASRALDEAYAPHAAWPDAIYAADAMRGWTFKGWGATAWVRHQPGGKDLQRLLEAIKEEPRISDVGWECSAVERIEEVLGEGQFGEWWANHHGTWRYVLGGGGHAKTGTGRVAPARRAPGGLGI